MLHVKRGGTVTSRARVRPRQGFEWSKSMLFWLEAQPRTAWTCHPWLCSKVS